MRMGLQYGLEKGEFCKRQNRWLFSIAGVAGDVTSNINALPPAKSARPSFSFKEASFQHLSEEIFYPMKTEWKPLSVTLYDLSKKSNPVYDWLLAGYNPKTGQFFHINQGGYGLDKGLYRQCSLDLVDATGETIERWIYEDAWPLSVDFGSLDMASDQILTCDLTIRYARAYIADQSSST